MAPNGTGIDKPSEWRGGGDAGWRVEMFAKDEQIRVLTARLAAAEDLLREDLKGTGHTPSWWSRLSKALQHQEVKGGEMRDTDREQIERGIASIGYFDIENCTCDPSVGVYPCHYCAEREAIVAGKRVVQRLAAAEAALARIALSQTGEQCESTFAQEALGWKRTKELWGIIKAAKGGRDE